MKKILHLASWFPTKENPFAGNFIIRQIEAVAPYTDSTILVVLFDQDSDRENCQLYECNGVHYMELHCQIKTTQQGLCQKYERKIKRYSGFQKLFEIYCRQKGCPDIIHVHVVLNLGLIAAGWSALKKIPLVITEHSSIYQESRRSERTFMVNYFLKKVFKQASIVLPVSEALKETMLNLKLHANYQVIPNVVNTDVFKPLETSFSMPKMKHILHVSTLDDAAKNITGMLRVVHQLYQKRQDFVLDIIHENPATQWVEAEKCVRFHGPKQPFEIAQFMQQSAFFLLFSNYENLPCVLLEAMACALPVLTTDVGGISEIVNSERGVLIPAADEVSLYQKIDWMLDHYTEFNVQKMRQFVEAGYSHQVVGRQLAAVYEQL